MLSLKLVGAEWCLGLFTGEDKGSFHHLVSSYTTGVKSNGEFPLGSYASETFVCKGSQTDRKVHTHTHTPKLLVCVGETGLGDRFGELVSMLWVIW